LPVQTLAADLYFADQPVFVFISFHESDLLSMAPLIKFICESLMMELITAYDDAPEAMKQTSQRILWSMDEAGRIGIPVGVHRGHRMMSVTPHF
jgi:hypothetical protein